MSFNSIIFILFFLPLTLGFYYLSKEKYRNAILLISSIIFFIWTGLAPIFTIILLLSSNYFLAYFFKKEKLNRKLFLVLGLMVNIVILFYFKYWNFLIENINTLFSKNFSLLNLLIPLGLSYIIFQQITYIVDLYRGKVIFEKGYINYALYVLYFPKLIAGPIAKYSDLKDQLKKREPSKELFNNGIYRFSIGLGKKIIIASTLQNLVDEIFILNPENLRTGLLWVVIFSYALQIYFDFSGYSDMAIGISNMFSIRLPENFNRPYLAKDIKDFWKRWHISLTTFLREYIYFPLGGNRKGKLRNLLNIFIIFFISGLWHGAAFTFIIWGSYHGLAMIINKLFSGKLLSKLPRLLTQGFTFVIVSIGWVFFRADNLNYALSYIKRLFSIGGGDFIKLSELPIDNKFIFIFIIALIIALIPTIKIKAFSSRAVLGKLASLLILIYSISIIASGSFKPFIYFNF